MAAKIINFPKLSRPLKKARSVELYYCWNSRLNNPFLNSLYRPETSYVERWYLQIQHLLHIEENNHPILQSIMSKNDQTLFLLIENTEKDLVIQRYFSDQMYQYSVEENIIKLNRWNSKWKSIELYRQKL